MQCEGCRESQVLDFWVYFHIFSFIVIQRHNGKSLTMNQMVGQMDEGHDSLLDNVGR